ncbi:MAG: glycosyltransferase family 2 protein [Gallionella sp.]
MHVSNNPKVSICIPTFNGAAYIRQAVTSVLEQDYTNFEIVIVDNCSTDKTAELVEDLQKTNKSCIRYYQNDHNIGLVANLNKCIEYAHGVYIKFLCVDDELLPGCIEQMVSGLELHKTVSLVSASRKFIDQDGRLLGVKRYLNLDTVVRGNQVITRCLFGGNFIGEPSAVMFRKNDLTGCFREDLPQLSDMDMWFQLLEHGDLLSLATPLCAIRIHAGQMTHANVKLGKVIEDNIKIFDLYSHKRYLQTNWFLLFKHKLLMTYRLWVSRKFISPESKRKVLNQYASRWAYRFMPVVEFLVSLRK